MALPTPDELRRNQQSRSSGLPSPNTIVPSLIKQREDDERRASYVTKMPDLFNPNKFQSSVRETFSSPEPPSPSVQQAKSLPAPGQLLQQQYERFQPQPEFEPVQASPLAKALGLDKKPLIGPSLTNIAEMATKDPVLRGVSRGAAFGLGDNVMPQRTGPAPLSEKVSEFAGMLFPGAAAERVAATALRPVISNIPRTAQFAARGIGGAALHGAGAETAQEFGGLNDQTLLQRLGDVGIEAALGGALGAAADVPRLLGNKAQDAARNIVGRNVGATSAIESAAASVPTGRLRVQNNTERLSKLMGEIKPVVTERMTPPLENPRELARWLQPHLGNTSLNDINRLPYEDMVELAEEVRRGLTVPNMARQVAGERGQDLDALLDGTAPNFRQQLERQRMGQVAGAIDPPTGSARVALNTDTPRVRQQQEPATPTTQQAPNATNPMRSTAREVPEQSPTQTTSPSLQPSLPRQVKRGERSFNVTVRETEGLDPAIRQGLLESPNRMYKPITNEQTLAAANRRIDRKGIDQAEAQLLGKKKFTAEDVATGMRLIQQLQDSADIERAVTIADKVASELTKAGQTVQAASIWNRLSPQGALLAAQRKVRRVNESLLIGQSPVKISPQQATTITEAAQTIQSAGISQERAGSVAEIMSRVRNGEQITPDERKLVADFLADAKKFIEPTKVRSPRPASVPKEMKDTRVRDRVVSFLEEQEQAALERIRARRGRANALPLDEWADYAIVGATKLAKNTIKFADWSEQMVRDLGEGVRPHLNALYDKSKELRDQNVKRINEQVVSNAERIANNYLKRNEANLTPQDTEFVTSLARKVSELSGAEQRLASQDLQAVLSGFEKVGIGRKLQSAQYVAMLLNPLTQIRNVVGNELLYRFERIQRAVSTPIDFASSKITGGPRTVTFKRGPNVWENFFQPTKDFWGSLGEGMRAGWRGVSPEGLTSKYEIQGQAFRSKYNPMTYLEKSLGAVLQGFDYAAYTRATNQRLSEMAYLDALNKGIKGEDAIRQHMQTVMTNIDDSVHTIAKDYGKFVTLQNDSKLSQLITGFRRGANKLTTGSPDFGAGSVAVPFAKTPANLFLRALDYSPAGILKAMKQAYDVLRDPMTDLTRADVIESVSRALLGTGIGAMAYWLTDKGAMFGKSDKDPEVRKLMQGAGIKDFQINGSALTRMLNAAFTGGDVNKAAKLQPGDTLWGYEWAQPASMPAAVGSNVYQGVKDDKGFAKTAADAAFAGVNTLLDSSVLSGIREIFQIPPNSNNVFGSVAMNLIKQVPSQFVPSLARQLNTLSDEKTRETYAEKSDLLGQVTNYAESTIPGLAQKLPQRVDTLGRPQTRLNTFLDVFVSPAARSLYKPTPEAQLVIDLINDTGDNSVAPRAVAKYLTGTDTNTGESKRIDLTPQQYVELQTIVGQETAQRLKKVNPNWTTEKKIEFIVKELTEAGKIGRNKLKKDLGLKVTK